jgi:hypothetical protein
MGRWDDVPIGSKALAIGGGWWWKTTSGWKWNGPGGRGGVYPRPGADWSGKIVPGHCDICGRFTDSQGRCPNVDSGYFEPAEHW